MIKKGCLEAKTAVLGRKWSKSIENGQKSIENGHFIEKLTFFVKKRPKSIKKGHFFNRGGQNPTN
jgi:hypothetical protein